MAKEVAIPDGAYSKGILGVDSATKSETRKILVDASGNTLVSDTTAQSSLSTIAGKDFATETTLSTINSNITKCDTDNVSIIDISQTATFTTTQATASGNTTLITPTSGKKVRVKFIEIFNSGTANITIALRFGASGTLRFKNTLAQNTGKALNLIGCNWDGAVDDVLIVNLSATGTVDCTIGYVEV